MGGHDATRRWKRAMRERVVPSASAKGTRARIVRAGHVGILTPEESVARLWFLRRLTRECGTGIRAR